MKTQKIATQSPRLFRPMDNAQTELYDQPHEQKWSLIKKFSKLRESSIDFLVKACIKHHFKKDTLFLAIKIMDILIKQNFQPLLEDFQLTVASLVILTTKYNEVYPVTIDQINLVTEKYHSRKSIIKTEGLVLECLDFEIPEVTVFSEIYNDLKPFFGKRIGSDQNKQNEGDRNNFLPKPNQKAEKHDEEVLISKTLKAIKQPESLMYGEKFLLKALLSYLKQQKNTGSSVDIVKANYIKTVIKRANQPEKEAETRKPEMPKYLSPRDLKLNPEKKLEKKHKIFVF